MPRFDHRRDATFRDKVDANSTGQCQGFPQDHTDALSTPNPEATGEEREKVERKADPAQEHERHH
ncbi:MAG: hypothetical protein QMB94_07265, partial [Phycisphaerales bacterium]